MTWSNSGEAIQGCSTSSNEALYCWMSVIASEAVYTSPPLW